MDEKTLRKNILDLQYSKNLQYFNTTIIALLTFFIGLAIAYVSQDISFTLDQILIYLLITAIITSTCSIGLINFNNKMRYIEKEISALA
ncbi:MAG: hypothetical protein Q8R18_01670 [bacterium]|nr:hypothetical protein [bacterium]